jgi:phosphatidylserine/phosphatidylglycerophosphate/cardiolipin synthase-like enzyme
MMVTNADFTFYNRPDYLRQLAKDAGGAKKGDRVALTTMDFDADEPLVAALMAALTAAAGRGVQIFLAVDAMAFLMNEKTSLPGPLWFTANLERRLRQPFGSRLKSLKILAKNGGHYALTNLPKRAFSLPQAGRSHIKIAVFNDQVYVGGHNILAPEEVDIAVAWRNTGAADWLFTVVRSMVDTGSPLAVNKGKDRQFEADALSTLYMDAGVRGQSLILKKAFELIDEAQEWIVFTCQFFPGGATAQHLLAAQKRGVKVEIWYSHPRIQGKFALGHHLNILRERTRLPAEFFARQVLGKKLHAKLLATEQGCMIGSHNYVTQGVQLGTAELSFLRRDSAFSQKAVDFIKQQLV